MHNKKIHTEVININFHTKKSCIKNGKWINGELKCSICGKTIALAYRVGNNIEIFKFPKFKKYNIEHLISNISFVKELDFSEFANLQSLGIKECIPKITNKGDDKELKKYTECIFCNKECLIESVDKYLK